MRPGLTSVTNVWGTLTNIRRLSIWAIRKSGVLLVALPELINAPLSTLRTVMMPAKGARIFWNDCISSSRWTLAWLDTTLASAAATLASSATTLAWAALTSAWAVVTSTWRSSTSCWATSSRSLSVRQRDRLVPL